VSEQPSTSEVARHGVELVLEEVRRRGGLATPDSAPRARNRLVLRSPAGRTLSLYVKTRRRGDWQTDTRLGHPRTAKPDETSFWVFVLLASPPEFHVVPAWWIENDIFEDHRAYLARHGGRRAVTATSTHHRIQPHRVEPWKDRWDLLGLEPTRSDGQSGTPSKGSWRSDPDRWAGRTPDAPER
jgi:hypothetical protein